MPLPIGNFVPLPLASRGQFLDFLLFGAFESRLGRLFGAGRQTDVADSMEIAQQFVRIGLRGFLEQGDDRCGRIGLDVVRDPLFYRVRQVRLVCLKVGQHFSLLLVGPLDGGETGAQRGMAAVPQLRDRLIAAECFAGQLANVRGNFRQPWCRLEGDRDRLDFDRYGRNFDLGNGHR